MTDARFEDGADQPLHLVATDADDVTVLSALLQDAVLMVSDMGWTPKQRRFALLVGRFRWEDRAAAEAAGRAYERVRSLVVVEDVHAVRSSGFDRDAKELVLSILSVAFVPGEDGTGTLTFVLAGDGAVALDVEALEARLEDVTRPYRAPSGKAPTHD